MTPSCYADAKNSLVNESLNERSDINVTLAIHHI